MWPARQRDAIRTHAGAAILLGSPRWGAAHVIASLDDPERRLIWIDAAEGGSTDEVALGNRLADAVRRALGSQLFNYGERYDYGLSLLDRHLELLGPFTFALSNADRATDFAERLLDFHRSGNRVVLHFDELPADPELPAPHLLLAPPDLALTEQEAVEFASAAGVPKQDALALRSETEGASEAFLTALHEQVGFPLLRPDPDGRTPVLGKLVEADVPLLAASLLQRGHWLPALEQAVHRMPELVPDMLAEAGEAPWVQGMLGPLGRLLQKLPKDLRRHDVVLAWRMTAFLAVRGDPDVVDEVASRLRRADNAPALRALHAEVLLAKVDLDGALREAERAVKEESSATTLFTHGRILGILDPAHGREQLRKALKLAEDAGRYGLGAQTACALAGRATTLGDYNEAVSWAEWGLNLYRQQGMGQVRLMLDLYNELHFARLLAGQSVGVEDDLRLHAHALSGTSRQLSRLLHMTLADLLLVYGDVHEARSIYRNLWEDTARHESSGALANLYVRALLEVGETKEALRVARQAVHTNTGPHVVNTRRAQLALGMALTANDPRSAIPFLERAMNDLHRPILAARLAQAGLYLAGAHLELGNEEAARSALEAAAPGLRDLSRDGRQYLAGSSATLGDVGRLVTGNRAALELRFLGDSAAWLEGDPVSLSTRLAELTAVLAMNPGGMSGEELTLAIYGERGDRMTCTAEVKRLRSRIMLTSRPYRIATTVAADFLEVEQLLGQGELMAALAQYSGPLLPKSDAPGIVAARETLDEALRRAILASGMPDALEALLKRFPDDVAILEALLAALPPGSPRRPLHEARLAREAGEWARD